MKKLLALFAFIFVLTTAAYAEIKQEQGYISVNVEATEDYNPTLVKLSFAIETRDKDPEITANLNKQQSEKVINAVKALIDTTKNETIKTTSYYFNPEYSYKDGKKLTGYIAVNTLQIAIKDPNKTGKIISTALSNGANSVSGLEFILEETNDNCNLLMQKAAKGAKERAGKIAASMNTTVIGIKSINASCSTNSNYSANFRMLNSKAVTDTAVEGAGVPVEMGKTKLRAYVNADFYVK